jgi:hypothetical protein
MKERLKDLTFPCYLVAYAPERTHRTKFRGENPGAFVHGLVYSLENALELVEQANYQGPESEIRLYGTYIATDEDGTKRLEQFDA